MAAPTPEEVQNVLNQMNQPQYVNQATQYLLGYLKNPICVPTLFDIVIGSPFPFVRQTAGVLLRKKLRKYWNVVGDAVIAHIKGNLLQRLVQEPERLVRFTIAELIASVGRVTLVSNEWPELFPGLFALATTGTVDQKEAVIAVIEKLCDKIGDILKPVYVQLHQLFTQALGEQEEPRTRVAVIKAAGALIGWLETEQEMAAFGSMIPAIMNSISVFIKINNEEACIAGFSVIEELFDDQNPSTAILPYLTPIVNFVLQVGADKSIDFNIRQEALTVVQLIASRRPALLLKNNLVEPIIQVALAMGSEPHDDGVDEFEITPTKFGAQVIDSLTQHVTKEDLFPILIPYCQRYMQSQNPWERKAAVAALTVAPAGMPDIMSENLEHLMPMLFAAFSDPHPTVKQSACLLLGQFAEYLRPEIFAFQAKIMPLIVEAMNSPIPQIQERACYSAIAYCEHLTEEEMEPFLVPMMTRLVQLLSTSQVRDVQEMSISTISAVASSADRKFGPFAPTCIQLMQQLMNINSPDQFVLRSRAIECVGVICNAIGKEAFAPHFDFFMTQALQGATTQNSGDLTEYTMSFFSNIAEALEEDFLKYIDHVLKVVVGTIASTDGVSVTNPLGDQLQYLVDENAPEDGEEDEEYFDPDEEEDGPRYSMTRSFVEEKVAALHTLGTIAMSSPKAMLPRIPDCMPALEQTSHYVHHDVRAATAYTLESFLICVNKVFVPARKWEKGLNPAECPVAAEAADFTATVIAAILQTIGSDEDPTTVARYLESLAHVILVAGPHVIHPYLDGILGLLSRAFLKKLDCFDDEGVAIEEHNESIDQENMDLFCMACDVVNALAQQYREFFLPIFPIVNAMLPYMEPNSRDGYRMHLSGTLAEIVKHTNRPLVQHAPLLLAAAMKAVTDPFVAVRSNGAFMTGLLCENPELAAHFPKILQIVVPLLTTDKDPQLLDNVCGCVARIIKTSPQTVDLSTYLAPWFASFPLKYDMEEYPPIIEAILILFSMSHPAVAQFIPHTIQLFLGLLSTNSLEHVPEAHRNSMAMLVKQLHTSFSAQLQPIIAQLSEHQKSNLQKILSS